jgi:hypothetical protein
VLPYLFPAPIPRDHVKVTVEPPTIDAVSNAGGIKVLHDLAGKKQNVGRMHKARGIP